MIYTFLKNEVNSSAESESEHAPKFKAKDFKLLVGLIIDNLGSKNKNMQQYLKDESRRGLSIHKYHNILRYLRFHLVSMVDILNNCFRSCVMLKGFGSYDESMWPWRGNHEATVHIDRKPKPDGFKVFMLAVNIERLNRPFCIYFMPDVNNEHLNVGSSLAVLKQQLLNTELSVTCDSWFGNYSFMMSNKVYDFTFAVTDDQPSDLWNVLSHNLMHREFRTFTNGSIIATIFNDAALVRTISTHFIIGEKEIRNRINSSLAATKLPPRLNQSEFDLLKTFSLDNLKNLAKDLGETVAGTKEEIALRIARLPAIGVSVPLSEHEPSSNADDEYEKDLQKKKPAPKFVLY